MGQKIQKHGNSRKICPTKLHMSGKYDKKLQSQTQNSCVLFALFAVFFELEPFFKCGVGPTEETVFTAINFFFIDVILSTQLAMRVRHILRFVFIFVGHI